jgi:DNA mismatch endonuclease (patch repair protein)
VAKIERNRQRDRRVARTLRALGWTVIRVWESDVRKHPERVAQTIARAVACK